MKSIFIILILYSSFANGQRSHGGPIYDPFRTKDSFDGSAINDNLLKVLTDTLPLYTSDETSGWRDMKLVSYYYDSLSILKKISFRNGQDGYYYFYFERGCLARARVVKWNTLINFEYYFTAEDNTLTLQETEQKANQDPEKKGLYEALKMGKAFSEKFKTLL